MIGKLTGVIDSLNEDGLLLDVNGVGYVVHASSKTIGAPGCGGASNASILIETQVREDAITLFGFADHAERDWFRLLRSVQGVGGKVALAILSTLTPNDLVNAVAVAGQGLGLARQRRRPQAGAAHRRGAEGQGGPAWARRSARMSWRLPAGKARGGRRRHQRCGLGFGQSRLSARRSLWRGLEGAAPRMDATAELNDLIVPRPAGAVAVTENRMVAPEQKPEDRRSSRCARWQLTEFIGQQKLRENLGVFIQAARHRGEALDHALFYGPPGLGKTTLAQIVARELGVGFRATSGPVIVRAGDLARSADQPAAARRAVHRRDPPPLAGGRGDPLSGDGGLPARPHHRRRSGGAFGAHRPAEVHSGRRHDPARPDHHAAA